jgi:putative ABC transport system permease protein
MVLLVGAEPGVGANFPVPRMGDGSGPVLNEALLIDQSNIRALDIRSTPVSTEVGYERAHTSRIIDGFGSFFGTPYVFTEYNDAVRYLGLGREETFFLIVHVTRGQDVQAVKRALQCELPEVDVWTRQEFSRRAQLFWIGKTGAGGALLTAAVLGFLVGLVIVSQNIYATTMENIEEFATLKAIGASRGFIQRVVLSQALSSGVAGSVLGLLATYPAIDAVRGSIPWIFTPWLLPMGMIGIGLLMCAAASLMSVRKAVRVEPARVFRA